MSPDFAPRPRQDPPEPEGMTKRATIPVNLALDSISFIDWVRATIPGIVGGSKQDPPERSDVIELSLLALYNYIMHRIAEESAQQAPGPGGSSAPPQ